MRLHGYPVFLIGFRSIHMISTCRTALSGILTHALSHMVNINVVGKQEEKWEIYLCLGKNHLRQHLFFKGCFPCARPNQMGISTM